MLGGPDPKTLRELRQYHAQQGNLEAVARLDASIPEIEAEHAMVVWQYIEVEDGCDFQRQRHTLLGVPNALPEPTRDKGFFDSDMLSWVLDQHFLGYRCSIGMASRLVRNGHVFVAALPVISWAFQNNFYVGNQMVLNSSGLDGVYTGAPQGEDGHVILRSDMEFRPAGRRHERITVKACTRFSLEVGYIEDDRCYRILMEQRYLARLPYGWAGAPSPHLFLFALRDGWTEKRPKARRGSAQYMPRLKIEDLPDIKTGETT